MSYIGNTPEQQSFTPQVDYFNGNNSTTSFTLSRNVASVAQVEAVIENVVQNPTDAYTVNGNTITFTSAPPSGTNNIYVRYTSPITNVMVPSASSVNTNELANRSVTSAKMANSGYEYGMRNRIINGDMKIDQRNAGASVTSADSAYSLDRWKMAASPAAKYTAQQNAGSVTPPVGFVNYLGVTSSSSYSVGASDYQGIQHRIEGFNVADLGWGTVNAAPITISFWVRSSLTGTFGGSLYNANANRSYPFTFSISASNTWEQKTLTVAGDTSGTWLMGTNAGLTITFGIGVGSTYSGTAGAWAGALYFSATGATSVVGTSGATFYITGVQLEKGTQATPFEYRPYGTELALCQRYCYVMRSSDAYTRFAPGYNSSITQLVTTIPFKQTMRVQPSLTWNGTFNDTVTGAGLGTVATMTTDGNSYDHASMLFNYSSGVVTINAAGACRINGNASWYAQFNSEL